MTVKGKLYGNVGSKMEVLTNASAFCLQQGKGATGCANDQAAPFDGLTHAGLGGRPKQGPSYWHFVGIEAGRLVTPSAARQLQLYCNLDYLPACQNARPTMSTALTYC